MGLLFCRKTSILCIVAFFAHIRMLPKNENQEKKQERRRRKREISYMAETIWSAVVTGYNFIMDNLVIINMILALVIIFFQRRSPQTVWTWLLLLYFIPILGFILYLIIGQDFHKSRMFKAKEIEGELKYAVRKQEETIYNRRLRLANPEMNRFRDLILYNLEAGEAVLTDNNDIRIYTDGKEKFRALIEEMRGGEKIYSRSVLHHPQR